MPHITLLYPFLPRIEFDEAESKIRQALEQIEPFEVLLTGFQHFPHGREQYTVWLSPEPRGKLQELQSALQSAVPLCDDVSTYNTGYTPHLSVGQAKGKRAVQKLEAELQLAWTTIDFVADQVSLIQRSRAPDDIFRMDRNIRIGR